MSGAGSRITFKPRSATSKSGGQPADKNAQAQKPSAFDEARVKFGTDKLRPRPSGALGDGQRKPPAPIQVGTGRPAITNRPDLIDNRVRPGRPEGPLPGATFVEAPAQAATPRVIPPRARPNGSTETAAPPPSQSVAENPADGTPRRRLYDPKTDRLFPGQSAGSEQWSTPSSPPAASTKPLLPRGNGKPLPADQAAAKLAERDERVKAALEQMKEARSATGSQAPNPVFPESIPGVALNWMTDQVLDDQDESPENSD